MNDRVLLLLLAGLTFPACSRAAAQGSDRSAALRAEVEGRNPLKLKDYREAEAARAEALEARLDQIDAGMAAIQRQLQSIESKLSSR